MLFAYVQYLHEHISELFLIENVPAIGKQVSNPFLPDIDASHGYDEKDVDVLSQEPPGKYVLLVHHAFGVCIGPCEG